MDILIALTLLVLAAFLGLELISKVPPTLHTPLMSGSNAVSGITLVGAIAATHADQPMLVTVLGFAAITLATINVVGGFLVTHRMLYMFGPNRKSKQTEEQDKHSQDQNSNKDKHRAAKR